MKRLTGRAPDGTAYLYNMVGTNAAIDRLADYEDTELTPMEMEYFARVKRGECVVTDDDLRQAGVSDAELNALKEIVAMISEERPIIKPRRWIPVAERLPNSQTDGDWVLGVVTGNKGRQRMFGACELVEYDELWDAWCLHDTNDIVAVSHWMPLPEPPGEE